MKLLVLGIDAMDPGIYRRLDEEGLLPNFRKLQFRELKTSKPPETPVAWSVAASGSNPGTFGIFDFLHRDAKTYAPRLSLSEEEGGLFKKSFRSGMKGKPFWRSLTEKNVPVSVLRWPVTFPPEKINGSMLSGLGVLDIRGSMNHYAIFTSDASLAKGEGAEKVKLLSKETLEQELQIAGPLVRKRGELREVPQKAKLLLRESEAEIQIAGGDSFSLQPGQWSDWQTLRFKVLPFHEMSGIAKFYLASLEPELVLYVSSIQINPREQATPITSPDSYGKELADSIGLYSTLGMAEDTKVVTEGRLPKEVFFEHVWQVESEREKMFWHEFEKFDEGCLAFVFDAGDRLCHLAWQNSTDGEEIAVSEEIVKYYRDKDRLLGEILEKGDDDLSILLLSDHGFSDYRRSVNVNRWLADRGFLSVKKTEENALFASTDWQDSCAYALGFTSLYLNKKGREGKGKLDEAEAKSIMKEIRDDLLRMEDGKEKVFSEIYLANEIYSGEFADRAPDLILGFSPGYRMSWKSALGDIDEEVLSDNDGPWSGDHLIDGEKIPGVMFSNRDLRDGELTLLDLAPSVLHYFGLEAEDHHEGESVFV